MQLLCPNCTKLIAPYDVEAQKQNCRMDITNIDDIADRVADIEFKLVKLDYFKFLKENREFNICYLPDSESDETEIPEYMIKYLPMINHVYLIYYEAVSITAIEEISPEEPTVVEEEKSKKPKRKKRKNF